MGPESIDSGSSTGPSKSLVTEEGNQSTEGEERVKGTQSLQSRRDLDVCCGVYNTPPCTVVSVRWSGLGESLPMGTTQA